MNFYAGLDVSLKETSVCIVDAGGEVVLERKVLSEPEAIDKALRIQEDSLRRVGIEASSLGGWLQVELAKRGFEAIVIEAHHTHVSLSTMVSVRARHLANGQGSGINGSTIRRLVDFVDADAALVGFGDGGVEPLQQVCQGLTGTALEHCEA
jgi:hypothetical protein